MYTQKFNPRIYPSYLDGGWSSGVLSMEFEVSGCMYFIVNECAKKYEVCRRVKNIVWSNPKKNMEYEVRGMYFIEKI